MDPSATCYTIVHDDLIDTPTSQELRNALQKGSDEVKLETMRRIIVGTLNGQGHVRYSVISSTRYKRLPMLGDLMTDFHQPTLLMPIIQFVMPSRNKQIKKLLHFYLE
jgi:coatomer subunit beta